MYFHLRPQSKSAEVTGKTLAPQGLWIRLQGGVTYWRAFLLPPYCSSGALALQPVLLLVILVLLLPVQVSGRVLAGILRTLRGDERLLSAVGAERGPSALRSPQQLPFFAGVLWNRLPHDCFKMTFISHLPLPFWFFPANNCFYLKVDKRYPALVHAGGWRWRLLCVLKELISSLVKA